MKRKVRACCLSDAHWCYSSMYLFVLCFACALAPTASLAAHSIYYSLCVLILMFRGYYTVMHKFKRNETRKKKRIYPLATTLYNINILSSLMMFCSTEHPLSPSRAIFRDECQLVGPLLNLNLI